MNKTELVNLISEASGITKAAADRALNAMLEGITSSLKKGDPVTLIGFGTFEIRSRSARTGRNPKTGDMIKIKASKVPAFRAGKALKDSINLDDAK